MPMTAITHRRLSSSLLALASLCALGAAGCAAKYNNATGITAQPVQILWNTTGPAQVDTTTYPTPTAGDPNPPLVQPAPSPYIGTMFSSTPLSAAELNATASTPGTFVYTPAEGSFLTPGLQTLSVTFTPKDTTNYKVTTRTVQIQVNDIGAASSASALTPQAVQIIGGGYVDGVYFHPLQKDLRYARTDVGGAYRWDQKVYQASSCQTRQPTGNNGETLQYGNWVPLLDFVGRTNAGDQGVESLGLDPSDPMRLYLSTGLNYNNDPTQQNHFMLSDDQGKTFTQVNAPFPINGNDNGRDAGERFGVDPNLGTTIYYGSRTAGLWKSLDRGVTWNQVTSFPVTGPTHGAGVVFVSFLAASGTTGTATPVIFAGVSDYNYYNTDGSNNGNPTYSPIYQSVDAGATWQAVAGQPTTITNPGGGTKPTNYNLTPIHGVFGPDGKPNSLGSFYVTYFSDQGPGDSAPGAGAVFQYTPVVGNPGAAGTWTDISPTAVRSGDDGGYGGLALDPEAPGTIMVTSFDDYNKGDDLYRTLDYGKNWVAFKRGPSSDINDAFNAPWLTFNGASSPSTGTGNWPSSIAIDPFNSAHVEYGSGQTLWDSLTATALDGSPASTPYFSVGAYGAAIGGRVMTQACSGSLTDPNTPPGAPIAGLPGGLSIEETVVNALASPPQGVPLLSAVGDLGTFVHTSLDSSPLTGATFQPLFTTGTSVDFAQNLPLTIVRVGQGSDTSDKSPYTPIVGAPAGTTCDVATNPNLTNCAQISVPQLLAITTTGGVASGGNSHWTGFDTLSTASSLQTVTSSTNFSQGGGTVAIAPDASSIVWAPSDFPPSCTGDSAKTWTPAVNGIIGAQVISDRVTPGVYYQYDSKSGQLAMGTATISAGSSSTFQCNLTFSTQSTLPAYSYGQLVASFGAAGDIWLAVNNSSNASANGIYHSSDFGKTLTQIAGFTQGYAIGLGAPATSAAVQAYSKPAVYTAATGASGYGFYRSIDNGATWVLVSNPQHLLGTVNVIIGDPRIFGRYYIGTGGRGIAYADSQ
jgi:hypothetical protein